MQDNCEFDFGRVSGCIACSEGSFSNSSGSINMHHNRVFDVSAKHTQIKLKFVELGSLRAQGQVLHDVRRARLDFSAINPVCNEATHFLSPFPLAMPFSADVPRSQRTWAGALIPDLATRYLNLASRSITFPFSPPVTVIKGALQVPPRAPHVLVWGTHLISDVLLFFNQ